jgi:hypothetical protein
MPKTLITERPLSATSQVKMGITGDVTLKQLRSTRNKPEKTVYVYNLGLADLGPNGELPNAKMYKIATDKIVINHRSEDELDTLLENLAISEARGLYKKSKSRKSKKSISKKSRSRKSRKHNKK